MADELEQLERFGELGALAGMLTDEVRRDLLSMSAASIGRYLKPLRDARYPSALSSTKPGAKHVSNNDGGCSAGALSLS